jgi:hypothetical protein
MLPTVAGAERRQDLCWTQHTALGGYLPDLDAADHRGPGRLVHEQVGVGVRDDLLAGAGADQQAEQVAHGPAGDEQRGFLAHPLRCRLLEPVHRGVVAEHIVAEWRAGHGPEHLLRGERHGVRPEVNIAHVNSLLAVGPPSGDSPYTATGHPAFFS